MLLTLTLLIPFTRVIYYSTKSFNRDNYFRRNAIAKSHTANGLGPNPAIISEVLDITSPILEEHMHLCQTIVTNSIDFASPTPNSEHVAAFAETVGPENTSNPIRENQGVICFMIPGLVLHM